MNKINKEQNIAQLIQEHPEVIEVLLDHGLHCAGCPVSANDTLEAGAKAHGLSDKEVDELLVRLNEVVEHQE